MISTDLIHIYRFIESIGAGTCGPGVLGIPRGVAMRRLLTALVPILLIFTNVLFAQERPFPKIEEIVPLKTAGGFFFWGDVYFSRDYHIQKNVKTGTYRLLDEHSFLRETGSFNECRYRLEELEAEKNVKPLSGRVVILLHGYGSSPLTMRPLADWLRTRPEYDAVFNMTYPTTLQPILEHARMLDQIVKGLPASVSRIDFVGHSLGSIVMRRYLSGPLDEEWKVPFDRLAAREQFKPDPRVGRFVMLGPPNHGAELATKLIASNPISRRVGGESGDELGIHWNTTELTLGIPCCPFGIVSGGRGDDRGYSALSPGDDDGIVSTEGTRLPGAEDWIQFHVGHGEMLMTEEVFVAAFRFLEAKPFRTDEESIDSARLSPVSLR